MTERDKKIPDPPATTAIDGGTVDVQHGPIGTGPGYSGQEYDADDFAIDRALKASAAAPDEAPAPSDDRMPPENGRRAFFDQKTGTVHGSGAGAGGGNPGEDFDSDSAAGDGFPQTGRGSRASGKDEGHEGER
jgi:hypothetical protein